MNLGGRNQTKWLATIGTILVFAFAFVLAMLMSGLDSLPWGNWPVILNVGLLFAVLGSFYGAIAALDSGSGMSSADHPFLRTVVCGILGATLTLLAQAWPPQTFDAAGPFVGLLVGAALGRLGWRWAKYVDF